MRPALQVPCVFIPTLFSSPELRTDSSCLVPSCPALLPKKQSPSPLTASEYFPQLWRLSALLQLRRQGAPCPRLGRRMVDPESAYLSWSLLHGPLQGPVVLESPWMEQEAGVFPRQRPLPLGAASGTGTRVGTHAALCSFTGGVAGGESPESQAGAAALPAGAGRAVPPRAAVLASRASLPPPPALPRRHTLGPSPDQLP